jgi:hypothetical protein
MSLVNGVMSTFIGTTRDPLPFVRYFLVEQDDLMVVGMHRVWAELVYQVEVVTNGPDTTEAVEIANRLDALLHRAQPGDAGAIHIGEIWRRQPIFFKEKQAEDVYVHAGGEYVMHVYSL